MKTETKTETETDHGALIKQWLDANYNYNANDPNDCYNWACIAIPNTTYRIGIWGFDCIWGSADISIDFNDDGDFGGDDDVNPTYGWLASNDLMWLTQYGSAAVDDPDELDFHGLASWIQDIIINTHTAQYDDIQDEIAECGREMIAEDVATKVAEMRTKYADANEFLISCPRGFANEVYAYAVDTSIDAHNDKVAEITDEYADDPDGSYELVPNDDDFWTRIESNARDTECDEGIYEIARWIVDIDDDEDEDDDIQASIIKRNIHPGNTAQAYKALNPDMEMIDDTDANESA